MAKLKCDRHQLRVFTHKGKLLHRNDFGGVCEGSTATIGDQSYTIKEIEASGEHGLSKKMKRILND